MTLSDELHKLAELRDRGQLTDEEFARAKARLLDPTANTGVASAVNALRRSRDDRWIAGVCGGLARTTETRVLGMAPDFYRVVPLRRRWTTGVSATGDFRAKRVRA